LPSRKPPARELVAASCPLPGLGRRSVRPPEMDAQLVYPAPLFVRNTFLDCMEARPPSLEEFLQERLVKSCPTSGISDAGGPQQVPGRRRLHNLVRAGRQPVVAATETDVETESPTSLPVRAQGTHEDTASECSTADTAGAVAGPARQAKGDVVVLDLQTALARLNGIVPAPASAARVVVPAPPVSPEQVAGWASTRGGPLQPEAPAAGTMPAGAEAAAGLPSAGSAGHFAGRCKPCAFVNSKGCSIGKDCQFCHLCEPGEKKRRQKEKRAFFSTMRHLQKAAVTGWR